MTAAIDSTHLAAILRSAARASTPLTYAEVLNALGFVFSRTKMRAVCVALDDIDAAERGAGQVALAVLVVRACDGLPGQGWWLGQRDYVGEFTGPVAAAYVKSAHRVVFDFWAGPDGAAPRVVPPSVDGAATYSGGFTRRH